MQLNTDTIQTTRNIPDCMTIEELQQKQATSQDEYLNNSENISSKAGHRTKIKYHKT